MVIHETVLIRLRLRCVQCLGCLELALILLQCCFPLTNSKACNANFQEHYNLPLVSLWGKHRHHSTCTRHPHTTSLQTRCHHAPSHLYQRHRPPSVPPSTIPDTKPPSAIPDTMPPYNTPCHRRPSHHTMRHHSTIHHTRHHSTHYTKRIPTHSPYQTQYHQLTTLPITPHTSSLPPHQ